MFKRFTLCVVFSLLFLSLSPAEVSRFWSHYDPETPKILSDGWWHGGYALGDWWGIRNGLSDDGVNFSLTYTNNIAGNPVGGMSQGATYTDNVGFGIQLDFEKLIGWQGASMIVSGLNRSGTSLSEQYIGNQFTVQQVYGGQTAMFYALLLEQKILDDRVALKIGRFSTGDDFASSPLYWLYMNNGIDGNPQALPVNTAFSAYPWAVWAARLLVRPTEETEIKLGVYQASDRIFDRAYHGLDWSIRPNDGVLLISQFGWSPEFFRRPVAPEAGSTTTKNTRSPGSSKKSFAADPLESKGYPGNYWFGFYFSPWSYPEFGSANSAANAYGFYWHADQMIFQESPGSDQGLTLWSAFVLSPQQNIAKLPFQVNGGLAYKGLIPHRDDDYTIFGVVYGKFSENYAESIAVTGAGFPNYELVFEWGYRIQMTQFAYVQPDVQWVINPGGTGNIPNALVLGAQMGVIF
jgi:porin